MLDAKAYRKRQVSVRIWLSFARMMVRGPAVPLVRRALLLGPPAPVRGQDGGAERQALRESAEAV
jgi:hypothetical protein